MKKLSSNPKLTFLGIVGIVVSLAVLAVNQSPPAHAQEEAYITDADEDASCASVCNIFVPPQTEEECRGLARSRIHEEESRHVSAVNRYQRGRQRELEAFTETYFEEVDAYRAVLNERVRLAKASATGPLTPGSYLLCSGTYTAGVAAA